VAQPVLLPVEFGFMPLGRRLDMPMQQFTAPV
jgi:hypothetical protein